MSINATKWAYDASRDHDLNLGEHAVLIRVADHADNEGVCWPGEKGLAEYVPLTERRVRSNLDRLENRGLLNRERRHQRKSGRGRATDRLILLMAHHCPECCGCERCREDLPDAASGGTQIGSLRDAGDRDGADPGTEAGPTNRTTVSGGTSDDQPDAASGRSDGPTGRSEHDPPDAGDGPTGRSTDAPIERTPKEPSGEPPEHTDSVITLPMVSRRRVSADEWRLAGEIITAFNEIAGTSYTLDGHFKPIIGRIREFGEIPIAGHREIIEACFAAPWWEGHPGPQVIYGNRAQFERSIEQARAPQPSGRRSRTAHAAGERIRSRLDRAGRGS